MSAAAFDSGDFGERIRDLRKSRRLSLAKLGELADITTSHVWELEQGRSRNPTVSVVWGLARGLGVSPAHLLGLDDRMPPLHPDALRIAADIDRLIRQGPKS